MTPIGQTPDAVPEADRLEQGTPSVPDERFNRLHPPDRPEADVLEQEIPIREFPEDQTGLDEDRIEPLDEVDWVDRDPTR
jgi:hypothetical protein